MSADEGYEEQIRFYSNCKKKLLESFEQGCDMVWFMFLKDHYGFHTASKGVKEWKQELENSSTDLLKCLS